MQKMKWFPLHWPLGVRENFHILGAKWCILMLFSVGAYLSVLKVTKHMTALCSETQRCGKIYSVAGAQRWEIGS